MNSYSNESIINTLQPELFFSLFFNEIFLLIPSYFKTEILP